MFRSLPSLNIYQQPCYSHFMVHLHFSLIYLSRNYISNSSKEILLMENKQNPADSAEMASTNSSFNLHWFKKPTLESLPFLHTLFISNNKSQVLILYSIRDLCRLTFFFSCFFAFFQILSWPSVPHGASVLSSSTRGGHWATGEHCREKLWLGVAQCVIASE